MNGITLRMVKNFSEKQQVFCVCVVIWAIYTYTYSSRYETDTSSVCYLITVYASMWECENDFSGGDDNTTINHIYCPIFHSQLILVGRYNVLEQWRFSGIKFNRVCVSCVFLFLFFSFFSLVRPAFQPIPCVLVNIMHIFFVCFDLVSIPYRIVFNKFSASWHTTGPIVKQIRNTHNTYIHWPIKGSNHKIWVVESVRTSKRVRSLRRKKK